MVDYTAKLITPRAPNFVHLDIPLPKGGYVKDAPKVAVSELTPEQKDELARLWREQLDEVAARQREEKHSTTYRRNDQ